MGGSRLVIVTPVFEDRSSFSVLASELAKELENFVLLAIEDGSVQRPLQVCDLEQANVEGQIVYLASNVGHQRAIATGLNYALKTFPDDRVVVMDSDGEDKPDDIPRLLTALDDPETDAAVAKRGRRSESLVFRIFYSIYKILFAFLTGKSIDFGNFMALKPRAVKQVATKREIWIHLAATVMESKLRIQPIKSDRGRRYSGDSKMNFVSLVLHGMRSIMVFAEDVMVRLGALCIIVAAFSSACFLLILLLKSIGMATPGWVTMVTGFLIVIFAQVGVLTLITLLITGVLRGGPPLSNDSYMQIIDRVEVWDRRLDP